MATNSTGTSCNLYSGQFEPTDKEQLASGIIGIIIFSAVFSLSLYGYVFKTKSNDSKYFYLLMAIMAVCEFPRYISFVEIEDYTCIPCYAMHIFADFFFFSALSFVALTFAHVLELGPYISMLYSKRGLATIVCINGGVCFIVLILCFKSNQLCDFFNNDAYKVLVFFEAILNFSYEGYFYHFIIFL
jgi:hypothetical protein